MISNDDISSETIKWLSYLPKFNVVTWTPYNISNFSFYTKSKHDRSIMWNSDNMVDVESMYFSSSKDKNPTLVSREYSGVIEEIWEIDYFLFKVYLFKYKWVDNNIGV